jgi:hypothetical protein
MGIDKPRQHNAPASIDNLRASRFFLDLVALSDDVDPAVADQHPAIANDRELGHFATNSRTRRTR